MTLVFKDFSGSYTGYIVLVFFPFYVSGRGSGGDDASGGGLVVDDVLIDGGDGWWLECSKSITRENIERLAPRRRVICFYFLCIFLNFFGQFLLLFLMLCFQLIDLFLFFILFLVMVYVVSIVFLFCFLLFFIS